MNSAVGTLDLDTLLGEDCFPELVLNETRQDKTGSHFPNWQYRDKTTVFWSRHSRKLGKNTENIIRCIIRYVMSSTGYVIR